MADQMSVPPLVGAVRRLAQQYQWHLLTETDWVNAASAIVHEPVDAQAARRAGLTVYSQVLYQACQDPARCEQAYRELYDYLWPQAHHKALELANDAAQVAIELVFRSFQDPTLTKCKEPKAFLHFAQSKLRDALDRVNKQQGRLHEPLDFSPYQSDPAPTPEEQVLKDETDAERAQWRSAAIQRVALQVLTCLRQLWQDKRLHQQLKTLILTFMDRINDEEIASRLQTARNNVQVLRSRGLDKLRVCLSQRLIADERS
jgi:DNA-directed RNA polymerase specialized sigma24 family protein